jgi:hypothetical protein
VVLHLQRLRRRPGGLKLRFGAVGAPVNLWAPFRSTADDEHLSGQADVQRSVELPLHLRLYSTGLEPSRRGLISGAAARLPAATAGGARERAGGRRAAVRTGERHRCLPGGSG